jgi:hypothetical protein
MGVLLLLGTAFLSISSTETQIAYNERDAIQAFYVAEAGLQVALHRLRTETSAILAPPPDVRNWTSASVPFGRGNYAYTVTSPGDDPSGNPILTITSVGSVADSNVRRVVRARVEPAYTSRYRGALHAREEINAEGEVRTDSYDSAISPGAASCRPECPNRKGTISTDATSRRAVELEGRVVIGGDALVGPEGDQETAMRAEESVTITGQRMAEDYVLPMPSVAPPSGLSGMGAIRLEGTQIGAVSGSTRIGGDGIVLEGNATLTLGTPGVTTTITVTRLRIEGNARLLVEGRVSLYVTDRVELSGNASVNPDGIPANLEVQFSDTGGDFVMEGNARFFGTVYGRNAEIEVEGNAVVFGSLVGREVEIEGNARVHYDEALGRRIDYLSGYKMTTWQEVLPR